MVYLYCITDARTLNFGIREVKLIDYGNFTVAAGRSNGFNPSSPRNIMEHYRINDLILRNGFTVLPFSYGTVIPLTALDLFIRDNCENIKLNLEYFRKKIEMGIKVLVFTNQEQTGNILKRLAETPGHRYLSRRIEKYAPLLINPGIVDSIRNDIYKHLGQIYDDFKIKIYNQKNVLINMAFLIKINSYQNFIQAYKNLKNVYPECKFLLSGPWPAYNFINLTGKYYHVKEGESCGFPYSL